MTDEFGVPWFSQDLTRLVHRLVPGRVYVVLASTGTGKTVFGLNVAAHLAEDDRIKTLVVATEEATRYYDLLACRAAGVSYAAWLYETVHPDERTEVTRWVEHYRATEKRFLVWPKRAPRLADICEGVDWFGVPHVLLVDHLHRLDRQSEPLPRFLDGAMAWFAHLAETLEVAVVLFAQVHRPPGRDDQLSSYRIPTVTSAMGSAKVEQEADVVLGLSRKLRDDVAKGDLARLAKGFLKRGESVRDYEEPNTARVTVLKHRMDDEVCRRSVLLTVRGGKMQDRLAVVTDDYPPFAATGDV